MKVSQKITPFLWFNGQAEAAAKLYTGLFSDSGVVSTMPGPSGTVMGVTFRLAGQEFIALNGGPQFTFTEAISLYVMCDSQSEVDRLWDGLIAGGGSPSRCGWLKDRFGLSWQIVPTDLPRLLSHPDREKAGKAMQAMLGMTKIDVAGLRRAVGE